MRALTLALLLFSSLAQAEQHPLLVHMNQWLRGSAQWRAANPQFDPDDQGERSAASVQQYGVNWAWHPEQQYLEGEIVGIRTDGEQVKLSAMYMFYNPATERVQYKQIGRRGWFTEADDPVRNKPLDYGLLERLDAVQYSPTGQIKLIRHDNVFYQDGRQVSKVYERDADGQWQQTSEWLWRLTSTDKAD